MKTFKFICFLFLALCAIGVTEISAQVFLQPIQVRDIKKAGSALSYFHNRVHFWNVARGGAKINASTIALDINTNVAEYNADLGTVQAQTGVTVGTTTTRPTCVAALRGTWWTSWPATDAADTSAQCCRNPDATYAWEAGGCT